MADQNRRFRDGFWDFVRNPFARWRAEAATAALRQRLALLGPPSQKDIQRLVQLLRHKEQRFLARNMLQEIGAPAVPALISALESDRLWTADEGDYFSSPFAIALWCLHDFAPPALFPVLLPRLRSEHATIRQAAAGHLANLGLDESVAPLLAATEQHDVISNVINGLKSCLERGAGSEQFREAMFEPVLDAVGLESCAPAVLLSLNRERASEILLRDEYFHLENRALHYIIDALSGNKVPLPRTKLLSFVAELRQEHDGYPREYHYASFLTALVREQAPEAECLLREAICDENDTVRRIACSAMLWYYGIDDVYAPFEARLQTGETQSLTEPQQVYVFVDRLYAEVCNGGFAQYFANPPGNQARDAVEAYRAIGADKTADIVARANSLFGPDGPLAARDARAYQLAKMNDQDFEAMDTLDAEFYDNPDRVETLLTLYVLKNVDHFREPAE